MFPHSHQLKAIFKSNKEAVLTTLHVEPVVLDQVVGVGGVGHVVRGRGGRAAGAASVSGQPSSRTLQRALRGGHVLLVGAVLGRLVVVVAAEEALLLAGRRRRLRVDAGAAREAAAARARARHRALQRVRRALAWRVRLQRR